MSDAGLGNFIQLPPGLNSFAPWIDDPDDPADTLAALSRTEWLTFVEKLARMFP
jgi:hypothetical protein